MSQSTKAAGPRLPVPEWAIVLLIAAVQFVNILDFVMVMPLGPMLARSLTFPESQAALVGSSYTAAAMVAGLLAAPILDRLDRRVALGFAMFGLVTGTALGGVAPNFHALLATRVLAGLFGGPATSL